MKKKLLETNIPFVKLPKHEQKSFLNRYADEWENVFDGESDWEDATRKDYLEQAKFQVSWYKKDEPENYQYWYRKVLTRHGDIAYEEQCSEFDDESYYQ
jgi:hypothetical protein